MNEGLESPSPKVTASNKFELFQAADRAGMLEKINTLTYWERVDLVAFYRVQNTYERARTIWTKHFKPKGIE